MSSHHEIKPLKMMPEIVNKCNYLRVPQMAQIHSLFSSLGIRHANMFTASDECLARLEEILEKLVTEDRNLHTYRRAIGFGQNISEDLVPLLLNLKDDTKIATKVIDTTIKILVNLTIPIEYLLSIETMSGTDVGRHTIFELTKLLASSKEAFTDSRSTKAVMDHIKFIVESDLQTDIAYCDSINNCLLLLRNILHVPETKNVHNNSLLVYSSMQNQIIWNLFTQSIDKVIIYLISCPQKMYWGVTMVQLIALLYKDQHVGTLQKLLNLWLEASLSDSSEDNESNTSPPDQGSDDSSPIITSDPTSDSSDNGIMGKRKNSQNCNQNRSKSISIVMMRGKSTETENSTSSGVSSMVAQSSTESAPSEKNFSSESLPPSSGGKKHECQSSQSEDFGYATQVENQESTISTSSNEEDQPHQKPVHQKPHTFQKTRYNPGKNRAATALEKKELRRKKLVKRSKTNTINMKGLMHHMPTDEDISNILKEFTVDFLLKGYGTLVQDLHSQLLSNIHHVQIIDTSHFFWLVTYFLKFATQLELDLEHVGSVLSHDVLSFLIFQAVWIYEELELSGAAQGIVDLKPCLRRQHLVVTAIREFLQAVETYQKMIHLSEDDRKVLTKLQDEMVKTDDLRSLFLLLLRQYNPALQSRQYLQDLILTNHNYLLFLDNATKERRSVNMLEHLKQFATVEIMRQYGLLLESFKENGEFVNNCVFTMMHHIGGDVEHLQTLFQPGILKTFSKIWETDYEICDDWSDLIEYIIHKFINTPNRTSANDAIISAESQIKNNADDFNEWTEEDKDHLLGYYNQSRDSRDTIAKITKKYEKSGVRHKTQLSIIRQLLEQNIINQSQFNDFMRIRQPEIHNVEETSKITDNMEFLNIDENFNDGDIKVLREYLFKDNKGKFVTWLQKFLIECCYVKLVLTNRDKFENHLALNEPTIYHFALLNLPIPLVPWTTEQTTILKYQPFVLLLHKLGFYLPIDTGKIFVTIPNFWNDEHVFGIAQQLGPIDASSVKFDVGIFKNAQKNELFRNENVINSYGTRKFSMSENRCAPTMVRYTPLTNQLSITIPGIEDISRGCPQPLNHHHLNVSHNIMDCSPIHGDDAERNSISETASIASDLTRMCVSDEEDKVAVLVIDQNKDAHQEAIPSCFL